MRRFDFELISKSILRSLSASKKKLKSSSLFKMEGWGVGVSGGSRGSTVIVLDVFILLDVFIFVHCDGRKIIPLSNFDVQETPREFLRDEGER